MKLVGDAGEDIDGQVKADSFVVFGYWKSEDPPMCGYVEIRQVSFAEDLTDRRGCQGDVVEYGAIEVPYH